MGTAEMTREEAIAEGVNIDEIMRKTVREAEKKSKLNTIFLQRDSFARTAVSTSSLVVDWKTGGGMPPSRVIGISGPEKAGKSLLVTEILNNQLKNNGYASYFDSEGGTDPIFLQVRGIDFNKFLGNRNKKGELKPGQVDHIQYYQPSTGNEVLHFINQFGKALPENRNPDRPPMIFVLDSVVGLLSDDFDIDKGRMALHARMYGDFMQVVGAAMHRTGCSFIYTNQIRQKPGVTHGSPDYEPCGNALQFHSSLRLRLNDTKPKLWEKDHPFCDFVPTGEWKAGKIWQEAHVTSKGEVDENALDRYVFTGVGTIKNRVYTPNQVGWIRIQFEENGSTGKGLDPVFDIFSFLLETGYIQKAKLTDEEKAAKIKVAAVKGKYEPIVVDKFDLIKEFGIPQRFDYYEFKKWVFQNDPKVLTENIRAKMIVSGLVYT